MERLWAGDLTQLPANQQLQALNLTSGPTGLAPNPALYPKPPSEAAAASGATQVRKRNVNCNSKIGNKCGNSVVKYIYVKPGLGGVVKE